MKGCKKCPAYEKCTGTYRGSGCAALRATYDVDDDPEIVTIGDSIRDMSDKELSECFANTFCHGYGQSQIFDWLQQPAED